MEMKFEEWKRQGSGKSDGNSLQLPVNEAAKSPSPKGGQPVKITLQEHVAFMKFLGEDWSDLKVFKHAKSEMKGDEYMKYIVEQGSKKEIEVVATSKGAVLPEKWTKVEVMRNLWKSFTATLASGGA